MTEGAAPDPDLGGKMQSAEPSSGSTRGDSESGVLAGSELCTGCGFCCDGLLFSWAPVEPDEAARLHLPVVSESGQLAQPCVFLEGTRCGVYERRPSVCRDFRCKLLRRVQAGEVSVEVAMKTVSRARSLRTELEACLPASQERLWNRVETIDPKGLVRKTAGFDMPTWAFAAGALWGLLGREFVDRTASDPDPDAKR